VRVSPTVALMALACVHPALAADPAPMGAVSFFDGACPDGWLSYSAGQGRAIVAAADGEQGRATGSPLLEGESPHHEHEGDVGIRMTGSTIRPFGDDPTSRRIASSGVTPFDTIVEEAPADVPIVRFSPCIKTEAPAGAAPPGMVLFFETSACPAAWTPLDEGQGRVLTAAAPDEPVGAFGAVRPLDDGEDRKHAHSIRGPVDVEVVEDTVWSGCNTCSHRWALDGTYEYRGQALPASSGLPYLQLRACAKDAPSGPLITRITHGADFQARPLAVGQHATVFGSQLGPPEGAGAVLQPDGSLARTLAGVQVILDGVQAPLFFVREDQINFQVPYELAGRSAVEVVVTWNGEPGEPFQLALQEAAPALFAWSDDPSRLIAVHADGSVNGPDNAASADDTLVLYASGEGQTVPPGRTGRPSEAPFPVPLAEVEILIGGEAAVIDYAGAAPGFVGLMQINVRMTDATGRAPVILKVGGVESVASASLYGE